MLNRFSHRLVQKTEKCKGKKIVTKVWPNVLNLDNEFIATFIILTNTKNMLCITSRAVGYILITSTIVPYLFPHKHRCCWYSCFTFIHPVPTNLPYNLGMDTHLWPQSSSLLFLFLNSSGLEVLPGSSFSIIWKANSNLNSKIDLTGNSFKWGWGL